MKVSIQFVNYKTREYLIDCLKSLKPQLANTSFEWEIHILDNASGDNLDDLVSERVFVWYHNKNEGFGAGHNILSQKSDSDFILILNTDLLFTQEGSIARLIEIICKTGADIVGPMLRTVKGESQYWDHGELSAHKTLAFFQDITGKCFWKPRDQAGTVAWVSGAVLLIKRKLFEDLKGFDESFFLYHEEVDLCFRARRAKAKVWYDPSVEVMHFGGVVASTRKYFPKSSRVYLFKRIFKSSVHSRLK